MAGQTGGGPDRCGRPQGGYAERAVVSESGLVAVPGDSELLRQGLSLLHDGPTALTLARNAAIRPGERVLVTGAAGGLGILLVQLAIAAGGHVVAAARGERKLKLLRSLGADAVDYSASEWTQIVRRETGGTGPDVILDGVGGQIGQDAFTIIAPGGRFSAHGAPSGSFAQIDPGEAGRRSVTLRGIEQVQFDPADLPPLVEQALAEVSAGRIEPVTDIVPADRGGPGTPQHGVPRHAGKDTAPAVMQEREVTCMVRRLRGAPPGRLSVQCALRLVHAPTIAGSDLSGATLSESFHRT